MTKSINKAFLWLHRWSGIAYAVIFIIVGLSGTLLTFRYEIQQFNHPDELRTELGNITQADFVTVAKRLDDQLPGADLSFLQMNPARPDFPMRMVVSLADGGFQVHYADPLSGELVTSDINEDFWRMMRDLHIFLMQGTPGLLLVFASGWVLMLCSLLGTWLWAPRLRKPKIALGVRWRATTRKLLLDLHNVTGIYLLIPVLLLGLTGVTLILARISPTELPQPEIANAPLVRVANRASQDFIELENALEVVSSASAQPAIQQIRLPSEAEPWFTFSLKDSDAGYRTLYVDAAGESLLLASNESDLSFWHELKGDLGVAIHEGYIWGDFGRWIVFVCGLTVTGGSITGVWLWLITRRIRRKNLSRDAETVPVKLGLERVSN